MILPCLSPLFLSLTAISTTGVRTEPETQPPDTQPFVAEGPLHRVLVRSADDLASLRSLGAVLSAEDYGGFRLALVDARRTGGVAGLRGAGHEIVDEMTLVDFNGYRLDGADPLGTAARLAAIPELLRAPTGAPGERESRLRIVQFTGPVKDAWLDSLRATGAFVVTYVANDAYVVKADAAAFAAIERLARQPFVLAVTDYHPAFKLAVELGFETLVDTQAYDVTVQVIADAEGEACAAALRAGAIADLGEPVRVLDYLNVRVKLDGANVLEAARDPRVFAIEPILEAKLLDERQGQIMANQLDGTGTQPSAPAYFTWLASKGFPGASNPFDFVVDVEDDGVDRGSLTDVNVEFKVDGLASGASRVAYNNNYTGDALADSRGGHGNINASIIFGYNNLTGSAFEDAAAYQYGLGIAPWVKVGNSKVFNNAGSGIFNQPTGTRMANAYNSGARISSNSWGFTSGITYNTESQAHDVTVRDAVSGTAGNQEMSILFAAGNSGSGASTVHPPGTAKNIITVGASENWRMTGTDGCAVANSGADNAKDVINFSSRGPTSDQRKKPEIQAPGTHIQGAASRATSYSGIGVCNQYWPAAQTLYAWSSGTSHSTPATAGAAALLRQFRLNQGQPVPSPALTKAWLIASATYMTGVGANDTLWSNSQGFGRLNMDMSLDSVPRFLLDQTNTFGASGQTYVKTGTIASGSAPFRVALAWTDVPGPTTGNAYVNNLDLEVTVNGNLYRGNVFTGANSVTGGTADVRNNLECVFLPAGTTGSFSITVRATNVAGDGVPGNADTTDQDFALLVYNTSNDCNGNGIDDGTDIGSGTSQDCDGNGVPDECQADTDGDGTIDPCDGCPNDPLKTAPGACGCGVAETDTDGDGTPNCNDGCPNDPAKTAPGACGCGVAETDTDGDGTPNCIDGCPNDPAKIAPGTCGCGTPDTDTDGDGTPNCSDGCPNDPAKTAPGICGCGVADTDSDGDGTPNCNDGCPNDPAKTSAGACGCGVADTDTDGDGTPNCHDGCPTDPAKIAPGACGCGNPETDTDGDGTPNCIDGCPNDPAKIAPGACGCGSPETDSDGDGTPDCVDGCPNDPAKTTPGQCGCGNPETDSDGDGTPNCVDGCPNDPAKTAPGICGCGTPDTDSDGDGFPDCDGGGDKCPFDPNKTSPGVCGCGVPDVDTDADTVYDCMDNCIAIPNPAQGDCDGDFEGDVCEIAAGAPDCNANGIPDACDITAGTSQDRNGDGVPDSCQPVGSPYCFGDGSSGACPCANAGPAGAGCTNSAGQAAVLGAIGTTAPDDLVLVSSGELATALTIFAQGTQIVTPKLFGDGLRCVGGSIKRLYSKSASGGTAYAPHAGDPSIHARSAALGDTIPSGGTRYYWAYYRDPNPTFCTGATFNASNALEVHW